MGEFARLSGQPRIPAGQLATGPQAGRRAVPNPHADGFFPPALARDELYARAQKLAKAARAPASGLF
jgi:hypothetical protein